MKHKKHVILSLVLVLVVLFSTPLTSFAGVIGSTGPGGGTSSGTTGSYKTPLLWAIKRDLSQGATLADRVYRDGDTFYMPERSSIAYLTLRKTPQGYPNNWFRWKTWKRLGHSEPSDPYVLRLWGTALLPEEFSNMAMDAGYREIKKGALYYDGTQYADAIWINPNLAFKPKNGEETKDIIISFSNSGNPSKNFDNSGQSAEWHWNNPVTSFSFDYTSKNNEYNYTHRISARQVTVLKKSTWEENLNGEKRNITTEYSIINPVSGSTIASWSVRAPELKYQYYKPFDLRTELPIKQSLLSSLGYGTNISAIDLRMKVDNYQEKVDTENPISIPSIDTNTPRRFKVLFENDQFGIPTAAEGGIDISETKPAFSEDINGVQIYWKPELKAAASHTHHNPPVVSIEFNGTEKLGTDLLTKSRTFRGGDFYFRSIKIGDYLLGSNGKPFWMANYQTGIYFRYGSKYSASVQPSVSGPSFSPVDGNMNIIVQDNNVNIGDISATIEQPILYAPFKVSTVGGYRK